MLPALAFVPPEDVVSAFEKLTEPPFLAEAEGLVDYFEDTWVGRSNRNRPRRAPNYPIPLWNCRQATLDADPRTNNNVEAYNKALMVMTGAHHPTIWKFIKALRKHHALNETRIEQLIAGEGANRQRVRYRNLADRILKITQEYRKENVLEFLRGIGHNFRF